MRRLCLFLAIFGLIFSSVGCRETKDSEKLEETSVTTEPESAVESEVSEPKATEETSAPAEEEAPKTEGEENLGD